MSLCHVPSASQQGGPLLTEGPWPGLSQAGEVTDHVVSITRSRRKARVRSELFHFPQNYCLVSGLSVLLRSS